MNELFWRVSPVARLSILRAPKLHRLVERDMTMMTESLMGVPVLVDTKLPEGQIVLGGSTCNLTDMTDEQVTENVHELKRQFSRGTCDHRRELLKAMVDIKGQQVVSLSRIARELGVTPLTVDEIKQLVESRK